MNQLLLVHSENHDPWMNLALEEHLVRFLQTNILQAGGLGGILYLWQNQNTVVIGRNQNAWTECQTGLLENEGGHLARRTTGGGAVFHDLGNLNFSLILPRRTFSLDDNFALITSAVRAQGIHTERSGRNDVLADGRKFSGNAFSLRQDVGLHHGTLLIDSDYGRLGRYLTVSASKLQAKGVASVKSRVINLREFNPDLTVADMAQAMEDAFLRHCSVNSKILRTTSADYQDDHQLQDLYSHFASWSWRYGQTIKFNAHIDHRFTWGHVDIGLVIEEGLVQRAAIYSDALDSDFIEVLAMQLNGCRFQSEALIAALSQTPAQDISFGISRAEMLQDLTCLINDMFIL